MHPATLSRTAGLDTLRALAIALVVVYHYGVFVSPRPDFGWAQYFGWSGVDLFFVLSGYLIASPVCAGLARGRVLSPARFLARRAWRTLPLYWLVLAAFLLFPAALGGRTPPPAWRFLTFTQNLGLAPGTAFSHAWSLCVEEQFYLVLPAVVAMGAALASAGRRWPALLRPGRWHGWALLLALEALASATRGVRWIDVQAAGTGAPLRFMTEIYYSTACRFDEFLPGVALAMLRHFHPVAWSRLMARGQWAGFGGAALVVAMGALALHDAATRDTFGAFTTVAVYPLLALGFAGLVACALAPSTWLHRARVPGAAALARWSYAIYLSHKPLAHVLQAALAPAGLSDAALFVVVNVACVALGAALHRGIEAPGLRWRDRLVPSSFTAGEGRAGAPHAPAAA